MNEPYAGPGKASHNASPTSNPPSRIVADQLPRHDIDMPDTTTLAQPAASSATQPPHHTQVAATSISIPGHRRSRSPPPPQALEQLANRLRLQSLAIKNRAGGSSSNFLLHNNSPGPLEADDEEEEDITEDPIFLKYQVHLSRAKRNSDLRTLPSFAQDEAAPNIRGEGPQAAQTTPPPNAISTQPILPDLSPIAADAMDTDEGVEGSYRLPSPLYRTNDGRSRAGLSICTGSGAPLYFRRSGQAAALCPLVVHKAARMRKRTKSTTKNVQLPREGNKGRAVAAELGEKVCLNG